MPSSPRYFGKAASKEEESLGRISAIANNGRIAIILDNVWPNNSAAEVWDVVQNKLIQKLPSGGGYFQVLSVSFDGARAYTGAPNGEVAVWDTQLGTKLFAFDGHSTGESRYCSGVNTLSIAPNQRFLLSAGRAGIRIWDLENRTCIQDLPIDRGAYNEVFWTQDCRAIACLTMWDKELTVWQLDWECVAKPVVFWDEQARPWLISFIQSFDLPLTLRTLFHGKINWTEQDFSKLIYQMQLAGLGWIDPNGVREMLSKLVKS